MTLKFQREMFNLQYIWQKMFPLPQNELMLIAIYCQLSNVAINFDLGFDIDLKFSKWKIWLVVSQTKMVQLPHRNTKLLIQR